MNVRFGAWITGILVLAAAVLAARREILEAVLAVFAAVAVSRWTFPEAMKASAGVDDPQRIRWSLLLFGLVFGWFGVSLWAGIPKWLEGGVLQAISLFCLVKAFPASARVMSPLPGSPIVPSPEIPSPAGRNSAPILSWILFLAGAFLLAKSILVFRSDTLATGMTWLLWGFLAVFAAVVLRRPKADGAVEGGSYGAWVFAILAAAVLMRFPFIHKDFTGFQIDEANHLIDAVRVLKGELYSPFMTGWWGNPSFVYFITAGFFEIFGISLASGRALSAVLSVVSLYLFYRLTRFYVAPAAALLSTLLFSFAWYHLFYSLSPFTDIFTLTFELAAFFFLERGLREGRRADFAWTGIFLAASVMSYISGRLAVLMAAVSILARLLLYGRPFLKAYLRHLWLVFLSFLWLIGPFLYYVKKSPEEFMGRSKELSIFTEIQRTGDHWLPLKTFAGTLLTFFRNSDPDPRFGLYHVPTVDPVTAVLLVLGFMVTILRPRSWLTWIILPGLLFATFANSFAIQGMDPSPWYLNMQRFYLVLPFVFLLVARGLEWFLDRVRESGAGLRAFFMVLLAGALAFAAAVNADVYYRRIAGTPSTWDSMAFSHLQATRLCIEKYPTHHILVDWEIFSSVGDFMVIGTEVQVVRINHDFKIPVPRRATRDVIFIFIPYKNQDVQAKVRERYPTAEWTTILNTHKYPSLLVAVVKKDDFERARNGEEAGPDLP